MEQYKSLYSDLRFEREGLFSFIHETYACRDVLYPGCSIHITPSFYFPHVVYVDQSKAASQFFAEQNSLLGFVNLHKAYKRSAYIRFIHKDYSTPLPLRENSFDLLLALFAEGVSKSCVRYLRIGGILLTNNHRGDAVDAARDASLALTAIVRFGKGKYRVEEENPDPGTTAFQKPGSRYLKQMSQGMVYVENETYYVFERQR